MLILRHNNKLKEVHFQKGCGFLVKGRNKCSNNSACEARSPKFEQTGTREKGFGMHILRHNNKLKEVPFKKDVVSCARVVCLLPVGLAWVVRFKHEFQKYKMG